MWSWTINHLPLILRKPLVARTHTSDFCPLFSVPLMRSRLWIKATLFPATMPNAAKFRLNRAFVLSEEFFVVPSICIFADVLQRRHDIVRDHFRRIQRHDAINIVGAESLGPTVPHLPNFRFVISGVCFWHQAKRKREHKKGD